MMTNTLVPRLRAIATPIFALTLSLGTLSGCYLEEDDNDKDDKEITAPEAVNLTNRDDVIAAVATVWNFAGPWAQVSAPARATAPEAPEEGGDAGTKADERVTVDCTSAGRVTYDDTAGVTSYDKCTEIAETTDEATGSTTTDTSVIDGTVNEACVVEDGDSEPTEYRCFNAAPLDLSFERSTRTPAADEEAEESTSRDEFTVRRDAYLQVYDESESGYRLMIGEERRQQMSATDVEGVETEGETRISTEGFEIRMENTGDAETPAYAFELNGEAFFTDNDAGCVNGQLRIGSTTPLAVDPESGLAPTAGTLVLSTDKVAALAVNFAEDRSVSFRLNGEDLTATAEELSAACMGSYKIPAEDSAPEDNSGDELCLFEPLCLPGGF